jgi:hypothetical protein
MMKRFRRNSTCALNLLRSLVALIVHATRGFAAPNVG